MSSTALHVARGDRGGGYEPPIEVEFPGRAFESLASEDLDGDGRSDLALSDQAANRLLVVSLAPDGMVTRELEHETLELPGQVRAADLDGDPHLDVVVAHRTQPTALGVPRTPTPASLLRAEGAASTWWSDRADGDRGRRPRRRAARSTSSRRPGRVCAPAPGRRAGRLTLLPELPVLASSPCLAAGDVDGDGSVRRRRVGTGTSSRIVRSAAAALARPGARPSSRRVRADPRDLELVDRDGDGLTGGRVRAGSSVAPRDWAALGRRGARGRRSATRSARSRGALVVADLDGDGRLDCATGEYAARRLSGAPGQPTRAAGDGRSGEGDADASGDAAA